VAADGPTVNILHEPIGQDIAMASHCLPTRPVVNSADMFFRAKSRHPGLSRAERTHWAQRYIPSEDPAAHSVVAEFDHHVFCGKYSRDGQTFASACQDTHLRIFDTSTWTVLKDIQARDIHWSIIDVDYSGDGKYLAYSSWSDYIHMVRIDDLSIPDPYHVSLNMRPETDRFCLFSIRFSANGREILGGSSDSCVYLYDLERNERVVRVRAHTDDINAVEWADDSSNVFYSGSDDNLCKVWDRRLLDGGQSGSAVGVMCGHMDGITCLNSKNDGHYFISNSKDQTIKLWDTRKMLSSSPSNYQPRRRWDYRYGQYHLMSDTNSDTRRYMRGEVRHRDDCSIHTYRGHRVLQTLIRSSFSPAATTGQRYIISGSHDATVYIYDVLTGQIVRRLEGHKNLVRDVSWHPYLPEIVSTSWDGTVVRFRP